MDQDKIWSYFQNERADVFSDSIPRLRHLVHRANRLVKSRSPAALNIGVGDGLLEERLLRQGWSVRSLDPTENAIKRLREKGIEGTVGRIEALPYKDSLFDVVFCSEVLEHLSDSELDRAIREIIRVLKVGGYLLGTVPYKENLEENEVICPDCGKIFHRWGHHQHFDHEKLRNTFGKSFKVSAIRPMLFINWRKLNLKRKTAAFIKLVLLFIGSHGSNEALYFEIRK
jgi:SAM-dependent methyltransferase